MNRAPVVSVRLATCMFAVFLSSGASFAAPPEELVRKSLENYKHNYLETALRYTHLQRDEQHDGKNRVSISRIGIVNGLPYERVLSRNGNSLNGEQEAKEEAKLAKRRNESAAERARRVRDYKNALAFMNDIPRAFEFKILPDEAIDGHANYVIECTPRAGFHPTNSRATMMEHIHGKMWIDKEDLQWRRAEAHVIDTISIGWILARIGPGATMKLEQNPVSGHDWQVTLIEVNGDAKVFVVKDRPIHQLITGYDFRPVAPSPSGNVSELQRKP